MRKVATQTKDQIKTQRAEIQMLIGSRYQDIIKAADKLATMHNNTATLEKLLDAMPKVVAVIFTVVTNQHSAELCDPQNVAIPPSQLQFEKQRRSQNVNRVQYQDGDGYIWAGRTPLPLLGTLWIIQFFAL